MSPTPDDDTTSFADLDLRPELLKALNGLGYDEPTPIQREAIPPMMAGNDLLGHAARVVRVAGLVDERARRSGVRHGRLLARQVVGRRARHAAAG